MWYGFDPGGNFGAARIDAGGNFTCFVTRSIDQARDFVQSDVCGVGIDSVLWWTRRTGGSRRADQFVRRACVAGGGKGGTVSPINSLQGVMFVPAYMLIAELREVHKAVPVTEAHPKALLHALGLPVWRPTLEYDLFSESWKTIARAFSLEGVPPSNEHERDAIVAAVCAREGYLGRWTVNLALERPSDEFALDNLLNGQVDYFWPSEDCASYGRRLGSLYV